jgi:hypothetical protein
MASYSGEGLRPYPQPNTHIICGRWSPERQCPDTKTRLLASVCCCCSSPLFTSRIAFCVYHPLLSTWVLGVRHPDFAASVLRRNSDCKDICGMARIAYFRYLLFFPVFSCSNFFRFYPFGSCCAPENQVQMLRPSLHLDASFHRTWNELKGARWYPKPGRRAKLARVDYGYSSVFGENFQVSPREGHEV